MYTRNGSFRFDDEGFLVSQTGNRVQGFNADDDGTMNSLVEDIQIFPGRLLQPSATDSVEIRGNFRPDDPLVGPFDVNDPEGTSTFRTSILSTQWVTDMNNALVRSANNEWELNAVVDGADIDGGVPGQKQVFPLGTLFFTADGRLQEEQLATPLNIPWNGSDPGAINFDFGESILEGGTGTEGTTQWNETTKSVVSFQSQNGYGTGELDGVSIDGTGQIIGAFTNGYQQVLGQVVMANFADNTGLVMVGGNNFVASAASGEAVVGTAQSGGRGAIQASTLELSTTELSTQFIDLIQYQRAFQANSRTIQTADGLLQEIFQILR